MSGPTIADLQAQIAELTAAAEGTSAAATYHRQANEAVSKEGLLSAAHSFLLYGFRGAARTTLLLDASVYKSCDVAIKALDDMQTA